MVVIMYVNFSFHAQLEDSNQTDLIINFAPLISSDDQSERGTRSNVIHIDYNGFRLSYTFKYMDLCQ